MISITLPFRTMSQETYSHLTSSYELSDEDWMGATGGFFYPTDYDEGLSQTQYSIGEQSQR